MLTPLELRVVEEHKIWGFASYLQRAFIDFSRLEKFDLHGEFLPREEISVILYKMRARRTKFDAEYSGPELEGVNPLQVEQAAWRLLSPRVLDYAKRLDQFTISYSPLKVTEEVKAKFLGLVQEGQDLLQQWSRISDSYGPKYDMALYGVSDSLAQMAREKEEDVKKLIGELSTQSR